MSVGTQSDDSLGLDEIGLNRPEMSKDLQDVYETLMNFQKRDSSTMQSFSLSQPQKQKSLKQHQDSFEDSDEKLSDILAAYGIKAKNDESVEELVNKPKVKDCENHSAPRV